MNKKRTNCLVLILNIIYVLFSWGINSGDFSLYIYENTAQINGGLLTTIYGSFIVEFVIINLKILWMVDFAVIVIMDIICAFQNIKLKKICFWYLALAMCVIGITIDIGNFLDIDEIIIVKKIIFTFLPILIAIKNIILIKRNKPETKIIISYILSILTCLLILMNKLPFDSIKFWWIISIIMLFIYIRKQEKNIEESKARKIINIILYWIIQLITCIGLCILVIAALIISINNNNKYEKHIMDIYKEMSNIQGFTNYILCYPVEKNNKYGFINENGDEVIPCEYDIVSYFFATEYNSTRCYFALAKKDNEFYILSNNNEKINISEKKYIEFFYEKVWKSMNTLYNENTNTNRGYVDTFSSIVPLYFNKYISIEKEKILFDRTSKINLYDNPDCKRYINNQFVMELKTVNNYEELLEKYENINGKKDNNFNVKVRKTTGEETFSTEYIPGYKDNSIETFSDGSIEFISLDNNIHGWYDVNGNKISISSEYIIDDIINNKVFLHKYGDTEETYYILDYTTGTTINTDYYVITNNGCIYVDGNNKMSLYDKNFKKISNDYDKIIANWLIDMNSY